MSDPIEHPPRPAGATPRELGIVRRLHRAASTIRDHDRKPAMLDGLTLLVELIEGRDRRRSFTDQFEHDRESGWAG